ncbi:hypothetical protein J5N97_017452 [Dioscorea zingiberensis]|uniref:Cupin type-1 domain-containing protein n=1 Tax=Dioscorea zingiberensis TaxID=325984 RepID=A0A9D5CLZ1_9LILI|nr:hypothetical protein J5N97_017452 [Dioscorea zingiberensis]
MGFNAMGERLLLLLLVVSWSLMEVDGKQGGEEKVGGSDCETSIFILNKFKKVIKSEGGEVKVVSGYRWKGDLNPMHIGFVSMEPNTLFIPQYIDANLILFIQTGEVKVGWIHKDKLVEAKLKMGDVSVIPAGSAFYFINVGNDEKLRMICSINAAGTSGWKSYQSFFIGGGKNPTSVITGFGIKTLTTAFNVTMDELSCLTKQKQGPIIFMSNKTKEQPQSQLLSSMVKLKLKQQQQIEDEDQEIDDDDDDDDDDDNDDKEYEESYKAWSWRKRLNSIIGKQWRKGGRVHSPEPYNLYGNEPSFCNDYGSSISIDRRQYSPLKLTGTSIYFCEPHSRLDVGTALKPNGLREYGIILKGTGIIQVVFPNGTNAMTAKVRAGDVFWVPRYFPFCQIASMDGSLEFFGYTTSEKKNRPQFLIGASSVLKNMMGPELAAAFWGWRRRRLERVVGAHEPVDYLATFA